jgi:hypothetical protein
MDLKGQIEEVFSTSFQDYVLESMIKSLFSSYQISYDYCTKNFSEEEGHDLLPFYRWVQLRSELRGLGGRFKEITTKAEPNGSSYHIIIDSDRLMLTVSTVDNPKALPRPALYRADYANDHQLDIFRPLPDDSKIYAVLTHGFNRKERYKPAFARIIFPAKGFEYYIHHIDLFAKFKSLIVSLSEPTKQADVTTKEMSPKVIRKIIGE